MILAWAKSHRVAQNVAEVIAWGGSGRMKQKVSQIVKGNARAKRRKLKEGGKQEIRIDVGMIERWPQVGRRARKKGEAERKGGKVGGISRSAMKARRVDWRR